MTNNGYVKLFNVYVTVLESYGRTVGQQPMLIINVLKLTGCSNPTEEEKVATGVEVRKEYMPNAQWGRLQTVPPSRTIQCS